MKSHPITTSFRNVLLLCQAVLSPCKLWLVLFDCVTAMVKGSKPVHVYCCGFILVLKTFFFCFTCIEDNYFVCIKDNLVFCKMGTQMLHIFLYDNE